MKRFETDLAKKLIERLAARQEALMTPLVLAVAYLDPEFQVLLTDTQREIVKIELQAVHKRVCLLSSRSNNLESNSDHIDLKSDANGSQICLCYLSPMQKMLLD